MGDKFLNLEIKENVAVVTLNRPQALNALNTAIRGELEQIINSIKKNDEVRAVVLTGSGRAFAAGKDIPEFVGQGGNGMASITHEDHRVFGMIRDCNKPWIAAINGFALGGGLEFAMSCHIRVAADSAIMGLPEVGLGGLPGAGGTQLLPRLIGTGAALYYLLTGENIPAAEAYRLGLVDKVVPAEKLMITAMAIAKVISQKGPIASRLILEAVTKGMTMSLEDGLHLEEEKWRICGSTEDWNNAIASFQAKKPVVFKGK